MELKEFISATLTEIQAGVQDEINKTIASQTNDAINPVWGGTDDIGYAHASKFSSILPSRYLTRLLVKLRVESKL